VPRRRCVGCGRIAPKSELLRLAVDPDAERPPRRVLIDPAAKLPGRGAYLCRGREPALADPACLERATRRGGIARALRSPVTLERKLVESVSR
jgi:predicted RNA-binding protein YlxR (DUF448 family)